MSEQTAFDPRQRRLVWLTVGCGGIAIAAIALTNPLPLEQNLALRLVALLLLAGFTFSLTSAALGRLMRRSLEPETVETSRWLAFFVFSKLSILAAVLLLLDALFVKWSLTNGYRRSLNALVAVLIASFVYSVLGRALIDVTGLVRRWPRRARGQ